MKGAAAFGASAADFWLSVAAAAFGADPNENGRGDGADEVGSGALDPKLNGEGSASAFSAGFPNEKPDDARIAGIVSFASGAAVGNAEPEVPKPANSGALAGSAALFSASVAPAEDGVVPKRDFTVEPVASS